METRIVKIDEKNPEPERIAEAARILREGGLVAFPTETVYGLGGNALDPEAAKKIYAAKGRPSDNPLICHIADRSALDSLVSEIPPAAEKLMERYWPGPMTLIFKKSEIIPYQTTGGLDTVAVRLPSHPAARALIRAAGVPVAAPSANLSGRPSCTCAEHVTADMDGRIDMILDGGKVGIGVESTIIDVTGDVPSLLRPGYISKEMLESVLGEVAEDKASTGPMGPDEHPKAPGMKYRHYAPKAEMTLFRGEPEKAAAAICEACADGLRQGKRCAVLCSTETKPLYEAFAAGLGPAERERTILLELGSANDTKAVARSLFDRLRECDSRSADVIFSEVFEEGQLGGAVMNRMRKAAGYRILDV